MALATSVYALEDTNQSSLSSSILEWLSQHESETPTNVSIASTTEAFILGNNDEAVGKITVSSGTRLQVIRFGQTVIKVKMGQMNLSIPTRNTDIADTMLSKFITAYSIKNSTESSKSGSSIDLSNTEKQPSPKKDSLITSTSSSDFDYSTPEHISEDFAKSPVNSGEYLNARKITVTARVIGIEMQDPDKFVVGLIMTSGLKPRVVFTDDVKKPFGLIDRKIDESKHFSSFYDDAPSNLKFTWSINNNYLMLHKEWNVTDPNYRYNYYNNNYPAGYKPKVLKQSDDPVIGIGDERKFVIRFLKANPNAVYFEILK